MKELKNTMNYGITLRKNNPCVIESQKKRKGKGVGKRLFKEVMAKSSEIWERFEYSCSQSS